MLMKEAIKRLLRKMNMPADRIFPLNPPLPLPEGVSEQQLFEFVTSVRVEDAPEAEMKAYGTHDFRRFIYTWGLAREIQNGKCLELGANPYFMTMLLQKFTSLDLSLANYFGPHPGGECMQTVGYKNMNSGLSEKCEFKFQHFNVENDPFPYPDGEYDLVIFAEILEHLQNDPCKVLREIKRILKSDGTLILTTPNIARFENVARLISGANIYDPYSGYGPYGRHNREYNRHELSLLLDYVGFKIDVMYTADVHANHAGGLVEIEKIVPLLAFRENDLGQYIFIRASNSGIDRGKKPAFLYRSYPATELE